jgi:hypothetical protein
MAERKTWIHGFYNNTFNASTQLWELRDSRNDALMAEGPKATWNANWSWRKSLTVRHTPR